MKSCFLFWISDNSKLNNSSNLARVNIYSTIVYPESLMTCTIMRYSSGLWLQINYVWKILKLLKKVSSLWSQSSTCQFRWCTTAYTQTDKYFSKSENYVHLGFPSTTIMHKYIQKNKSNISFINDCNNINNL